MTGPSDKTGKKFNAPTIIIIEKSKKANSKLSVAKVPVVTGEIFFFTRLPAIARTGRITPYRPINIAVLIKIL